MAYALAGSVVLGAALIAAPTRGTDATFDVDRVKRQISRAWEGNDRKAIRVAECESSLNPKATSPDGKYLGLWQFSKATWNDYGGPGDDPRDVGAYKQTVVAWALYQDRGWDPWPSCA
jgi:transglycosylase-like protein